MGGSRPLEGRAVLVTGASSGIGAEIARRMGAEGASVGLVGRDETRLTEVAESFDPGSGSPALLPTDLRAEGAPEELVERAIERLGRIDVLVNGAGLFLVGPVEETVDSFDAQWGTNVKAPFLLTVAALPELRRRKGSIIFLSSIAGKIGFPGASAYCATKGAIEQLTKALALEEAANGVRVNAIAPGNVETSMNAHLMADADYYKEMIDKTPLGRNGEVGDIAPVATFLASANSGWITGESITVDGGWTAQ